MYEPLESRIMAAIGCDRATAKAVRILMPEPEPETDKGFIPAAWAGFARHRLIVLKETGDDPMWELKAPAPVLAGTEGGDA
jgi:hypothetical protein